MVSLRCQGVLLRTCSRNQPRWHHRAHERPIDVLLSMWVTVLRPVSLVGCECRVHCQIQKDLHTCPRCRHLRRTIEWVLQALFPPPCICPRRVAGVSFECVVVVVMIVDDSKHFLCFHASVCWRPIVVFFWWGQNFYVVAFSCLVLCWAGYGQWKQTHGPFLVFRRRRCVCCVGWKNCIHEACDRRPTHQLYGQDWSSIALPRVEKHRPFCAVVDLGRRWSALLLLWNWAGRCVSVM